MRSIRRTRLLRSSTATISSTLLIDEAWTLMKRGNAGQTSSVSLAGVLVVQTSCRWRRRGDPKTTFRHRRHTWARFCHASNSSLVITLFSRAQKSNIASRASSGRMSIRPTSHQGSQQSLIREVAQRTYIDVGWPIHRQYRAVHGLSTSLPGVNLLESVTQGGQEMVEGEGGCWSEVGRLDDGGHAFERGHFGFC